MIRTPPRFADIDFYRFGVPVMFILGLCWWMTFQYFTHTVLEDAMITYRYAQNIALGRGFVFSEGERVLGTTTPLLTLFLALSGKVLGVAAIPLVSSACMTTAGLLAGTLNYAILRKLKYSPAAALLAMGLFYGNGVILLTSVGGMETPLVLFWMALSAYLLFEQRYTPALIVCALLVLTRIDGAIWAMLCLCAIVWQKRQIPLSSVLLSGLVLLPWLLFSYVYFGTLIPNTVAAKHTIGGVSSLPLASATYIKSFAWYLKASGCRNAILFIPWVMMLFIGVRGFLSNGTSGSEGKRIATLVIALFPLVYGIILFVGRAPYFAWYLAPPLWCSLLMVAAGIDKFWNVKWDSRVLTVRSAPAKTAAVALLLVFYGYTQNNGIIDLNRKVQENEYQMRRGVGLWLRDNTPSGSTVLMEAIGYQGFYSERRIIDLAGLVSPKVVEIRRKSKSNAEAFYRIISELKPDSIVMRSYEVDRNLHFHGGPLFESEMQRKYFVDHYREARRFTPPYPELGGTDTNVTVFKAA